ncbi:MAG TPA: hypothetical protein VJ792_04800 [Candidatus Nitrosotalea sp.]|nr:hypothetical protein [Candidatus Nitrosotalea sp.]
MVTEALELMQSSEVLCRQVWGMDDDIEIVAILNKKGRIEEMIARDDGVNKDLTSNKREMLFMEFVLLASMNKEYDNEFGKANGLIIHREKVLLFSFQLQDHVMVVITKPLFDPTVVQQRIVELIRNHVEA